MQLGALTAALLGMQAQRPATAVEMPPPPPIGDCIRCMGEADDALNTCSFEDPSCVSTASNDEAHFYAPWSFDTDRTTAAQQLVDMATGGGMVDTLSTDPFGVSKTSAAAYILGGVAAVVTGGDLPDKPERITSKQYVDFDGVLKERYTTARGSEYVRISFGESGNDPAQVIDAEFIFLEGDQIVDIRAVSRLPPSTMQGRMQLSLENGVVFDQNMARREMEKLRKALNWEITPVVSDFDPRFNRRKPTLVEKLFEPFKYNWEPAANSYNSGDCDTSACFE